MISAEELAIKTGSVLHGDGTLSLSGPATIEAASDSQFTFLHSNKYKSFLATTIAPVIITTEALADFSLKKTYLITPDPYSAFAMALQIFAPDPAAQFHMGNAKVDVSSKLGDGVKLGEQVYVGAQTTIGSGTLVFPQVYIGNQVVIGENCIIYPGVKILEGTVIGNRCHIHAGAVIGSDGFGFAPLPNGTYFKIPQSGNVILEDDVSVGANTCIDRATLGSTLIQKGSKLDNLIQIAHNVVIGEHSVVAAQTGIAGSTQIGHHARIGGQAGFSGHLKIAPYTQVNAQSGVAKSISKEKTSVTGAPAMPFMEYYRQQVAIKKIQTLEAEIQSLRELISLHFSSHTS
jgi:UDP-3-O-[3-hydroxymyristoyl] glucosamine N-acyltransferase